MPSAAQKLKQLLNERRPKGERWHGVTGDFDGTVDVADKPGFVYVRIPKGNGYEVGVFAGSANTAGMAVEIEQDPITGQRRVMNTDAQGVAYNGGGTIDYDPTAYAFTPHHARHELGGDDEVNIYSAQILPLQLTVTGTTAPRSITVSAGLYQIAGISYIKSTSSAKDLTSYYPASGVKYVWLLIDAAGTLSAQDDGATVYGALVQPSNEYFIAAIIQCRGSYGIAVADILDHRYHQPILPKLARGSVVAATAVMWGALDNSTSGNVLVGNGADIISTAVAGDATFTSAGTLTLASITTAGTFGDATHVARVTIDVKGRVTTATEVVITGALVGAHDILSTSHSDTTTAAVVRGDLMTGQGSTAAWARLALGGASGSVVSRNADDVLWSGFHLAGTAGQTYTFPAAGGTIPTGTGAATRVAYWTGTNTVGSDANLTWDATRLTAQIADAGTTTVVYPLRVSHITSGAADAGLGAGIEFQNENSVGNALITGSIASRWIAADSWESRLEIRGSMNDGAGGIENPLIGVICSPLSLVAAGMPDGNARGSGAVELQARRSNVTEVASGDYSTLVGGFQNTASGTGATVIGGSINFAIGINSIVIGGGGNVAAGQNSVVLGGEGNDINAAATFAIALGRRSHIGAHTGAFLFADSTDADFNSVAANEFALRARGGFRHAYDDAYYWTAQITSAGLVTFDIAHAAGTPTFTFAHDVAISTLTPDTIIYSDANRVIASLGNAAGVLTNDGVGGLSWGGAVAHDLLSATHSDTAVNAANRGSLIYGNATPVWDELVIGGAAGSFVTRDANDVKWSGFYFSGTAGGTTNFAVTNTKTLTLTAADSYNLTVPATGTVALLGTANVFTAGNTMSAILTVNANIQFPAVQVPDAGANVLDDYAEGAPGSWTPALKFGGASVGMTYSAQTGTYTKIGRQVFITISITLTAKGSSVGAATITGLPFAVGANSTCAVYCAGVANLTSTVIGRPNGTSILLYDTGATANTPLDDTNFANTSVLNIGAVFSV